MGGNTGGIKLTTDVRIRCMDAIIWNKIRSLSRQKSVKTADLIKEMYLHFVEQNRSL